MRKTLSIILCVLLSLSCLTCVAESQSKYAELFDINITSKAASEMGFNARTWLESEKSRAIFTCMLMVDFGTAIDQKKIEEPPFKMTLLDNVSYIGRDGITIYLMIMSEDKTQVLVFMYKDASPNAGCFLLECKSQSAAEYALQGICPDGCYKNDPADLYEVSLSIKNALGE